MAKSEDYLDGLLESFMNDPKLKDRPERVFETEDNFFDEFDDEMMGEDSDELLRQFEEELEFMDDEGASDDFGNISSSMKNELDDVIGGVEGAMNSSKTEVKEAASPDVPVEKNLPQEPNLPDLPELKLDDELGIEKEKVTAETIENGVDGEALYEEAKAAAEAAEQKVAEVDEADAALMDLIKKSGDDEALAEIGDLLKADEEGVSIVPEESGDENAGSKEDSSEEGAEGEEASKEASEEGSEADGAGSEDKKAQKAAAAKEEKGDENQEGKKERAKGLFGFLLRLVFGKNADEEDEENEEAQDGVENKDKMSAENQAIIETLEGEKKEELSPKEAKKKAKKEAAEAKKKAKKEAAEAKKKEKEAKKAAKPPKEKKQKPPKDPNKKPIKKRPIIVVAVFTFSVVLFVKLLSSAGSYSADLIKSHSYYKSGLYIEAYNEMAGQSIHKGDEDYYKKAKLLALMQNSIKCYEVYKENNMDAEALDALIRACGRYESNYTNADELGILSTYTQIETEIEGYLSRYGLDYDSALEIYSINKRYDYTIKILEIIRDMET
ncbi:MAG: hypothetical protein K6G40_00180 [Eubacterium sp.]|nr:hypothetical protein [Eubacterium sp.]